MKRVFATIALTTIPAITFANPPAPVTTPVIVAPPGLSQTPIYFTIPSATPLTIAPQVLGIPAQGYINGTPLISTEHTLQLQPTTIENTVQGYRSTLFGYIPPDMRTRIDTLAARELRQSLEQQEARLLLTMVAIQTRITQLGPVTPDNADLIAAYRNAYERARIQRTNTIEAQGNLTIPFTLPYRLPLLGYSVVPSPNRTTLMLYNSNMISTAAMRQIIGDAGIAAIDAAQGQRRSEMSDALNKLEAAKYIDISDPANAAKIAGILRQANLPNTALAVLRQQAKDYADRVALVKQAEALKIDPYDILDPLKEGDIRKILKDAGLPDTAYAALLDNARAVRAAAGIPSRPR